MADPFASASAALFASVLAEAVTFTPQIGAAADLDAIRTDVPADEFDGRSLRRIAFDVRAMDLDRPPIKDDVIEDSSGEAWIVVQVSRIDGGTWRLNVERKMR